MASTVLGKGSYGQVVAKDGCAVKKFEKVSHLIQEYCALQYLEDCKYVVHTKGVDFENLELKMELYDTSLSKWMDKNKNPNIRDIMKILHDVLLGLIEIHDRGLAHGDIKPGNILVNNNPLRAVLGDCGFVSVAKYAKVERTAPVYCDPVIGHSASHDMYSFGIVFLEFLGNLRLLAKPTYETLKGMTEKEIKNPIYQKIILSLLHEDKQKRPSARQVLKIIFHEEPEVWVRQTTSPSALFDHVLPKHNISSYITPYITPERKKSIRNSMKQSVADLELTRGKRGYGALLYYLDVHQVPYDMHNLYLSVTLMTLKALFGKSGMKIEELSRLCRDEYSNKEIYKVMTEMLSDKTFIRILLAP